MWPAPERDIWRPRPGILSGSDLRRALRERPAWRLTAQRLVRELRFKDFPEALGFVERLAGEAEDFGRHPDICLHDGKRVLVSVASPRHAGITVGDLRLTDKVDAVAERYRAQREPAAAPLAAGLAIHHDSHEHPLGA